MLFAIAFYKYLLPEIYFRHGSFVEQCSDFHGFAGSRTLNVLHRSSLYKSNNQLLSSIISTTIKEEGSCTPHSRVKNYYPNGAFSLKVSERYVKGIYLLFLGDREVTYRVITLLKDKCLLVVTVYTCLFY